LQSYHVTIVSHSHQWSRCTTSHQITSQSSYQSVYLSGHITHIPSHHATTIAPHHNHIISASPPQHITLHLKLPHHIAIIISRSFYASQVITSHTSHNNHRSLSQLRHNHSHHIASHRTTLCRKSSRQFTIIISTIFRKASHHVTITPHRMTLRRKSSRQFAIIIYNHLAQRISSRYNHITSQSHHDHMTSLYHVTITSHHIAWHYVASHRISSQSSFTTTLRNVSHHVTHHVQAHHDTMASRRNHITSRSHHWCVVWWLAWGVMWCYVTWC
jgi:hypothetical protein